MTYPKKDNEEAIGPKSNIRDHHQSTSTGNDIYPAAARTATMEYISDRAAF